MKTFLGKKKHITKQKNNMKPFTSKHSQASRLLKYNAVDDHATPLHKKTKYSDVIASTDVTTDEKGNKQTTEIVHKGGPIGPGENTFGTIGGYRRGMGRLGEKVYQGRKNVVGKGRMTESKVVGSDGFRTSIDPITGEKTSIVKEKSASAIKPKGLTPLKAKGGGRHGTNRETSSSDYKGSGSNYKSRPKKKSQWDKVPGRKKS